MKFTRRLNICSKQYGLLFPNIQHKYVKPFRQILFRKTKTYKHHLVNKLSRREMYDVDLQNIEMEQVCLFLNSENQHSYNYIRHPYTLIIQA